MGRSADNLDPEDSVSSEPNPWSCINVQDYYRSHGVHGTSDTFISPRGLRLFTRTFVPASGSPSACICMIHGYTNDISWSFQSTAIRFVKLGMAAFAMDMEGHGKSEGLKGYVPNLDLVAQDYCAFFASKKSDPRFKDLPFYLFGESLGGGVCLLVHLLCAQQLSFNGAILVSPMCKISDGIKPPWPLPQLLTVFSLIAPTLPAVPTQDLRAVSFKDPAKLQLTERNPNRYAGKPRLGTASEMIRVTGFLGEHLRDVSLPFIVLHGKEDVVTDPAVSQALYETAQSCDKTLKLYDGMWHALLAGEFDADVDVIFSDIQNWLQQRINKTQGHNSTVQENGLSESS